MDRRCNRRFKDGTAYCSWNIVKAKRCADDRLVREPDRAHL